MRAEHERWDGSGYPDGLDGEDIPMASRICLACDAYDAMTTDRPYRARLSYREAVGELRRGAGRQSDPRVVNALLEVLRLHPLSAPAAAENLRLGAVEGVHVSSGPTTTADDPHDVEGRGQALLSPDLDRGGPIRTPEAAYPLRSPRARWWEEPVP